MLRVTAQDGAVFVGVDEKDIVRQMKHTDWNAPERKGDYMDDVAARVDTLMGATVRATGAKYFLKDLESLGLVTIDEVDAQPADAEGLGSAPDPKPSTGV